MKTFSIFGFFCNFYFFVDSSKNFFYLGERNCPAFGVGRESRAFSTARISAAISPSILPRSRAVLHLFSHARFAIFFSVSTSSRETSIMSMRRFYFLFDMASAFSSFFETFSWNSKRSFQFFFFVRNICCSCERYFLYILRSVSRISMVFDFFNLLFIKIFKCGAISRRRLSTCAIFSRVFLKSSSLSSLLIDKFFKPRASIIISDVLLDYYSKFCPPALRKLYDDPTRHVSSGKKLL